MKTLEKKKILLTINNNRLSGIERFCILLADYIDKEKFDVSIAMPEPGPLIAILNEKKIKYIIFNNGKISRHTFKGIRTLYKIMKANRYDIIHAQAGIAPCIIGKLLNVKIRIEHKHGLDFTSEKLNNLNRFYIIYESLKKYFVNKTVTVCENDKRMLTKYFNYKPTDVEVVYNGIENSIPENKGEKKQSSKFIIGNIGRLTFQKGQEYLIEAARILRDNGYENFIFNLYGSGENFEFFEDLITKNRLNNIVFLKGYTNNVVQALNQIDILVLTSRYEGIPYVILEAMRSKIPLICTNVGGISEVIKNYYNGILIDKENSNLLAEKIIELYNDEYLMKGMIENAFHDFLNKFTVMDTVKKLENIYYDS